MGNNNYISWLGIPTEAIVKKQKEVLEEKVKKERRLEEEEAKERKKLLENAEDDVKKELLGGIYKDISEFIIRLAKLPSCDYNEDLLEKREEKLLRFGKKLMNKYLSSVDKKAITQEYLDSGELNDKVKDDFNKFAKERLNKFIEKYVYVVKKAEELKRIGPEFFVEVISKYPDIARTEVVSQIKEYLDTKDKYGLGYPARIMLGEVIKEDIFKSFGELEDDSDNPDNLKDRLIMLQYLARESGAKVILSQTERDWIYKSPGFSQLAYAFNENENQVPESSRSQLELALTESSQDAQSLLPTTRAAETPQSPLADDF